MKHLIKNIIPALMLILIPGTANSLNNYEQMAQKSMNEFLKRRNYETKILEKDQSINFMVNGNLFWLTFEGNANGMLYTLHRRPIKLTENTPAEEAAQLREKAVYAANAMNAANPYKAYLNGDKVEFEFPVYALSPVEYQAIFPLILKKLDEVKLDKFKVLMNEAARVTDSIHNYWKGSTGTAVAKNRLVVKQPVSSTSHNAPKNPGKVVLSNPLIQSVDKRGDVLVPYGEILYQDKMQFMQPKISASADKGNIFELGVQIITPDGKTMVPAIEEDMSLTTSIELGKKEKVVEFGSFGSAEEPIWKPGKYTVIFFVNGEEALRQTVNIL